MCSIRAWLTHDSGWSYYRAIGCTAAVTSIFLVGCGSTPSFEAAAVSYSGTQLATSLSVPVPPDSGSNGAELLIAVLGIQGNPNTFGPAGWTPIPGFEGFNGTICQADGQGTACQLSIYYKIASGSEATAEFSWGGARGAAGAVLRYSNIDPADPIGVVSPRRGSSDGPSAPVITTTRDGVRVVRIVITELDDIKPFLSGSVAFTVQAPSSRLNIVSFPDGATDPTNGCGPPLSQCDATERGIGLAVSDTRHPTVEGSGPANWELPAPDQWAGASVEIMSAPDS